MDFTTIPAQFSVILAVWVAKVSVSILKMKSVLRPHSDVFLHDGELPTTLRNLSEDKNSP